MACRFILSTTNSRTEDDAYDLGFAALTPKDRAAFVNDYVFVLGTEAVH
jgi:hypothetical protein